MQVSEIRQSGMPTGRKWMGWWGEMGSPTQKGITQYTISPYQTANMRGAVQTYIFYGYKRIMQQAPYFAIPFAAGYGIYTWGKKTNAYNNSKAGHLAHGHDE
ncbi:ubiquinol--cytochrome-c reductase subunit 8 [Tilletia horrida]|nr:ubiquinol--cytochrome-c reductase subunit 8 [Tilletia horrida]KAK0539591.1 ubiquinol--cytochrome-c reductase subunit 8 [Tilletia horrida]KAK0566898.1 ubiquinol--cytochrome-c reductase subunit 8 [Tilletia horrida]